MNTNLPPVLEEKLAAFRRRVWVVKLAEAAFAALFGLALSYLLVFGLDRFFETPGWIRLTLLILGAASLAIGVPLKWHRWVWRQRRLEDAARLLRRSFPGLGDQLLGIVELARMDHAAAGRSERLVQAAMAQAADAVKDHDFTHAVPEPRHRQWGWAAAAVVVLVLVAFSAVNAAARNAFARWLSPLSHNDRFTFARLQPLAPSLIVPYAEPFALPVRLQANTLWSPEEGAARIGDQPWVSAKLSSGAYTLNFPPQKQDARLSLVLGDVRKTISVVPEARPELSALLVRQKLPAYLQYKSDQVIDARGGSVSLLKGSSAAFEAKATRSLAKAELDGTPQRVDHENILTASLPVVSDVDRAFTWRDQDGLAPRDPFLLKVRAVEDEAPRVIARRDSQDDVVLDSEVVSFDVNASDDFGVKQIGLQWVGALPGEDGAPPAAGSKISAAGGPEKKTVEGRATFCATREGVAPQTIQISAWTTDYLPGRPHTRSASFVLHVLNKTDHALWLTAQFGKWLDAARESYEREQQLHQTNKELRALSAAELDRPENRRRVAQQASAENANAARLDSLTASGRNLVEQAAKNDEFDAKRLESWATMLKSLKDIAATRMPSVSDLLKQTAGAATGKLAAGAQPPAQPGQPPQNHSGPMQKPGDGRSGLSVGKGGSLPTAAVAAAAVDPNATPKPKAPGISDREAGFGKPQAAQPATAAAAPKPPGTGKLRLPVTTLAAAPAKKGDEDAVKPPESPAQAKMDTAIVEQKDLLAEFAKVSDQLSEILGSLEASTFVKRFKAASRQQMTIATNISQQTLHAFGIEHDPGKAAEAIAKRARDQSEAVRVIQSDLDAYFQRKQDSRFKTILADMRKTEIVRALSRDGDKLSSNLSGQSLTGSEFWADTLDRWAEELVAASNCKSSSTCSGDSLPPEIVLKVMQALRDEMKLRDQTRETENSKAAIEQAKYASDAAALGANQADIGAHTHSALEDILALPSGSEKFAKEVHLLTDVVTVMDETRDILSSPDTGGRAIAAETEAIELLLQAKRPGSKGGGVVVPLPDRVAMPPPLPSPLLQISALEPTRMPLPPFALLPKPQGKPAGSSPTSSSPDSIPTSACWRTPQGANIEKENQK